MDNLTLSIFGNKVFLEILKELNLFTNYEIKFFDNLNKNILDKIFNEEIIVFFINEKNLDYYFELKNKGLPVLLINDAFKSNKKLNNSFEDQITTPFSIINFKNKIIAILAKQKFKKSFGKTIV